VLRHGHIAHLIFLSTPVTRTTRQLTGSNHRAANRVHKMLVSIVNKSSSLVAIGKKKSFFSFSLLRGVKVHFYLLLVAFED